MTITVTLSEEAAATLAALIEGAIDGGVGDYDPGLIELAGTMGPWLAVQEPAGNTPSLWEGSRDPWCLTGA